MKIAEGTGSHGAFIISRKVRQVEADNKSEVLTHQWNSEYAHVGSVDGSNERPYRPSRSNPRRYGSYVVRAPPSSKHSTREISAKALRDPNRHHESTTSRAGCHSKTYAVLDPLVEESLQRTVSQQCRLSCILTPKKSQPQPPAASPASAKSGHRRSLSRFTKELERYCVAASANVNAQLPPSTPTVSESPTTLNTVAEFLPYHRQFNAAGLAVTSREQMPRIPESVYPQMAERDAKDARRAAAGVGVDGSTVSASDQVTLAQQPPGLAVPYQREDGQSKTQPTAQSPRPAPKSINTSLLLWGRKDRPPAFRAHSDRKFSKDHIHPSQAIPAVPFLTPSAKLGLLDSYFETPLPLRPMKEVQPDTRQVSFSSPELQLDSLLVDKPLPKKPRIRRRPVPPRRERRHMENTAQWPTAGVLIHDYSPSPPRRDDFATVFDDDIPEEADDANSVHSWVTEDSDETDEPQQSPPVPLKESSETVRTSLGERPSPPPKSLPKQEPGSRLDQNLHTGHSICSKWHKATCFRRRSRGKPLPVPTTIREESDTSVRDARRSKGKGPVHRPETASNTAAPQLPVSFPATTISSSSFERALDAVIFKLDAMEERRRYERRLDKEAAQRSAKPPPSPDKPSSKTVSSKPSTMPTTEPPVSVSIAPPPSEELTEYADNNINDRDVLLGLKMAICAACDEDLDAWIREKTGLRLRRFLADLKAFDSVSKDLEQPPPPPQPMSRRIRRNDTESRRLQAEQARRKRDSAKAWTPCFGGDGQTSAVGSEKETC